MTEREKNERQQRAADEAEHRAARTGEKQRDRVHDDRAAVKNGRPEMIFCWSHLSHLRPQHRSEENMEQHVSRQVDRIAKCRVNTRREAADSSLAQRRGGQDCGGTSGSPSHAAAMISTNMRNAKFLAVM